MKPVISTALCLMTLPLLAGCASDEISLRVLNTSEDSLVQGLQDFAESHKLTLQSQETVPSTYWITDTAAGSYQQIKYAVNFTEIGNDLHVDGRCEVQPAETAMAAVELNTKEASEETASKEETPAAKAKVPPTPKLSEKELSTCSQKTLRELYSFLKSQGFAIIVVQPESEALEK